MAYNLKGGLGKLQVIQFRKERRREMSCLRMRIVYGCGSAQNKTKLYYIVKPNLAKLG